MTHIAQMEESEDKRESMNEWVDSRHAVCRISLECWHCQQQRAAPRMICVMNDIYLNYFLWLFVLPTFSEISGTFLKQQITYKILALAIIIHQFMNLQFIDSAVDNVSISKICDMSMFWTCGGTLHALNQPIHSYHSRNWWLSKVVIQLVSLSMASG